MATISNPLYGDLLSPKTSPLTLDPHASPAIPPPKRHRWHVKMIHKKPMELADTLGEQAYLLAPAGIEGHCINAETKITFTVIATDRDEAVAILDGVMAIHNIPLPLIEDVEWVRSLPPVKA